MRKWEKYVPYLSHASCCVKLQYDVWQSDLRCSDISKVEVVKVCPQCDHQNPEEQEFCEECGFQLPADSTDGPDSLLGQTIAGRYKIEELIGQGAMGRVYRAVQQPINRQIAVKVLHHHLMEDRRVAKRFEREAQAASRFNHPNSIGIIDFGQENESLFIAMEYITGQDLAEAISGQAPIEPERAVNIATQVLSALQLAHANQIIHRDLKPENIMLEELPGHNDFVKVCDFGIAKIQQTAETQNTESALTMFGMICGTPYYMSPEQAKGEELDGRTDLYSMGVILYEMLTGEVPFQGTTPVEVIARHLTDPPTPPTEAYPNLSIPRALEEVVMQALSKDRETRFKDAQTMSQALEKALKDVEFKHDLAQLVKDAESSPPVVVGQTKVQAAPTGPVVASPRQPAVASPRTSPQTAFPSAPVIGAPLTPPPPVATARAVVGAGLSIPYTPPPHSGGPGTLVQEAPREARDKSRQTFDSVSHTPLPHQAVRSSRSKAASTSYAGVPMQDFDQHMADEATLPRKSQLGKWLFLLILLGGLGFAGYKVYEQQQQQNLKLKLPTAPRSPSYGSSKALTRQPVRNVEPPARRDDDDNDNDNDDDSPKSRNRTRPKVPQRRIRRRARQRAPARRLSVAYISPKQRFQQRQSPMTLWMRRNGIRRSDLPRSIAQALDKADRAAQRHQFGHAQRELRGALRYFSKLRTFPAKVVEKKYKRVSRRANDLLKDKNFSKHKKSLIKKYLYAAQESLFNGDSKGANRNINRALRYTR